MLEAILSLMLSFAPTATDARLRPRAEAILAATSDPREQALLVVVDWHETALGRGRRSVPFGVTCCWRHGPRTLPWAAATSLRILRRSRHVCGRDLATRLGFYQLGVCRVTPYSRNEAMLHRRAVARIMEEGRGD
jgi:hypothetical protein